MIFPEKTERRHCHDDAWTQLKKKVVEERRKWGEVNEWLFQLREAENPWQLNRKKSLPPFVKRLMMTTPAVVVSGGAGRRCMGRKQSVMEGAPPGFLHGFSEAAYVFKVQHLHSLHKPRHFDIMPNSWRWEVNLNPSDRKWVWGNKPAMCHQWRKKRFKMTYLWKDASRLLILLKGRIPIAVTFFHFHCYWAWENQKLCLGSILISLRTLILPETFQMKTAVNNIWWI